MIPHRPLFWGIEGEGLFYALAAVAGVVFLVGVSRPAFRWVREARSQRRPWTGRPGFHLVAEALLGRRIFEDLAAGVMHALILWGFLGLFAGTVLIAVDHHLVSFLRGDVYLVFSALVDLAGVMFVAGLVWALLRRYAQRVPRLESRVGDLVILLWLLGCAISGFLVEGLRLAIEGPEWAASSFVGLGVSGLAPVARIPSTAYPLVWWGHAALSLSLLAALPFTKLFHALAAPACLWGAGQTRLGAPAQVRGRDHGNLAWVRRVFLDACTHCGRCVDACPSNAAGEPLSPRAWIGWGRGGRGPSAVPADSGLWHCTGCGACLDACPVRVAPAEILRAARTGELEGGTRIPESLAHTLEKLHKYDNPWQASKRKRGDWCRDLPVADAAEGDGQDLCYFAGCTASLDTRAQSAARAFLEVSRRSALPVATLGKREPCCGEIARSVGEEGLFEEQMDRTLGIFASRGIRRVVASSPHCLHALRTEAPVLEARRRQGGSREVEARSAVEALADLAAAGRLAFEKSLDVKVTYHDPCFLGRQYGLYDAPRRVLAAIPGVTIAEMAHHRRDALCCGGGGARMWQHDLDGEVTMSRVRMREAQATGAAILVTACPRCLIMLSDAGKSLASSLEVMDLAELVLRALGEARGAETGRREE